MQLVKNDKNNKTASTKWTMGRRTASYQRPLPMRESIPYNACSRRIYSLNIFLLIGFELKINEKLQRANATTIRACYK